MRLNAAGRADDAGTDADALDFVAMGTEAGRADHESHWPLWVAGAYTLRANGSAELVPAFSGVYDWGEVRHSRRWSCSELTEPRQVYAQISFPAEGGRQISVAWTYEDEEGGEHVYQRGYQGAFTSFRDLFLLEVRLPPPAPASHTCLLTASESDEERRPYVAGPVQTRQLGRAKRVGREHDRADDGPARHPRGTCGIRGRLGRSRARRVHRGWRGG